MARPAAARQSRYTAAIGISAAALIGLIVLAPAARSALSRSRTPQRRPRPVPGTASGATVAAARRLNRAAGAIAASVLADSALEHYRGSFHNRAMVAPLVTSALSLAVSIHGNADARPAAHHLRDSVYLGAAVTGLAGTGFHLFNIAKKPNGFPIHSLFYAAPIGAPSALILSGVLGFLAERVRDSASGQVPTIGGLPAGRVVAAVTGIGLAGTAAEAGLLHFRGAYHDPFMFLPVTIPPLAAGLLCAAATGPAQRRRPLARLGLRATAVLGIAGAGFHVMGVARNMGGWRNWSQNVLNGPPVPAPPSFTGLALAGLAGLGLLETNPDE